MKKFCSNCHNSFQMETNRGNPKYCLNCRPLVHDKKKKEARKKWYTKNTKFVLDTERKRYIKNKEKIKKRMKEYRKNNPKIIKNQSKKYYKKNHLKIKKYQKKYRQKNKDIVYQRDKKYKQKNIVKIRKIQRDYMQIRTRNDPEFKIKLNLRTSFGNALKRYTKRGKITSSEIYGIDYKRIIEHLKPFPEDLSKYHIDHIKPLCSFNFVNKNGSTNLEEIKKAFTPGNHQWLLAKDNISKGGKWDGK